MRSTLRIVAASAFAVLAAYATPAQAGPHNFTRVDGTAVASADSHVELTSVFAVADPLQGGANEFQTVECAFFINHGPQEVRHLRVRWSYAAVDAGSAGTTLGSDTKDIWGNFAPNVAQEAWPDFGNALGKQCQTVKATISGGQIVLWKPKQAVTLTAQIEAVGYADGTSWTNPAPAASAP